MLLILPGFPDSQKEAPWHGTSYGGRFARALNFPIIYRYQSIFTAVRSILERSPFSIFDYPLYK